MQRMIIKPIRLIVSLLFVPAAVLLASEGPDDLGALLDEASAIATKSSLNADYMPSVVTVIDADTFRDAGIQTLAEALDMLPGFQIQISPMGYTMTTVRGLKNPNAYLSDKIKIMVDGVTIYNEVSGSSNFYMDFPLQMVEKIEVLRGPASTLYGAGSFYATINIITKTGKRVASNRVQVGVGSYEALNGGANLHTKLGNWELFFDGYYQRNDKQLYSKQTSPDEVDREGYSDEAMRDYGVGLLARSGGLRLQARFKQSVSGNYYGFEGKFNPIPGSPGEHKNSYFFTELAYTHTLGEAQIEYKATYAHRDLDVSANIYGIEETAARFETVDIDMQEGFVYRERSSEENVEIEAVATLPKWHGNALLGGVGVRYADVTSDRFYSSIEETILANETAILTHPDYDDFRYNETRESAFWANPTRQLLSGDPSRTIVYGYLQDLVTLTPDVDMVLGLRLDHYSDFGAQWSKRAGVIYRADERLSLKLLYGSAFRAPTFIEAYQNGHINFRAGDESIKPEETDTYEFVTVFKPLHGAKLNVNLFYSKLRNVIDLEEYPDTDPGYQNFDTRYSRGVELEFFYKRGMRHDFYANATRLSTDYVIPPEEGEVAVTQSMPDISRMMLKAMYTYRPTYRASFSGIWRFYSKTTATQLNWVEEAGIDPTVDPTHIFDVAMTYRFSPASITRFAVKNLFDADVRSPAYYYLSDGGVAREGINFHLSFEQQF